MADTRIEIIVSGERAEEVARQLAGVVPEDANIVVPEEAAPTLIELLNPALAASAELPARLQAAIGAADGGLIGPFFVALIVLAIAYAADFAAGRYLTPRLIPATEAGDPWVARARAAVGWAVLQILRLVLFVVLTYLIGLMVLGSEGQQIALLMALLTGVLRFRIVTSIVEGLAASRDPGRRPNALTDDEAKLIMRGAVPLMVVFGVITFFGDYVENVIGLQESWVLASTGLSLIETVAATVYFVIIRRPIARLFRLAFTSNDGQGTLWTLFGFWPVLYAVLLVLTVVTETFSALTALGGPAPESATYSFQIFVLTPFLLAGIAIWGRESNETADPNRRGYISGMLALLEGAIIVLAAVLLLYAWNIDPFATEATGAAQILPGLVTAALTLVVGVSAWRTISAFLDVYAPVSEQPEGELPDGEGGRAGDRMETLYPIFRIVAGVVVGTLTVLLALSALGVQIAPLLAGAGILGLAFGFGAQTLVKDVIAGMFYLYEDAFRMGEYIETAEGKGAVEKIMLRSVRLRHPRGAVTTIPFGALGTIENHSRDWVTVKFSFEVGPSEDLERVRKLVKKVGVKLAEDPELEGKFLEPLKSQGAIGMVGANFQIGVKFTCQPGEQFAIRRRAFLAIQKGLRENGIQIPTPRVVVDSQEPAAAAGAVAATSGALSEPNKSA